MLNEANNEYLIEMSYFCKISNLTQLIQMMFDKIANWGWIILQVWHLQNLIKSDEFIMRLRLNLIFFRYFDHIDVVWTKMHNCMYFAALKCCIWWLNTHAIILLLLHLPNSIKMEKFIMVQIGFDIFVVILIILM